MTESSTFNRPVPSDAEIERRLAQLLYDLEAARGLDKSPRARHLAICITELENVIARFGLFVQGGMTSERLLEK